jgi:GAF domain-containing protein
MTLVSAARDGALAAPTATAHDDALDLLSGMAVALGHDVDLDFLLAELATGVSRTLDAERVSVLLLDDDGRLTPAVAVARQHNDDLWQRFRRMPPIALEALPGAREALAQGKVLVIEDASTSPLIPTAWQRTFALGSLAVAPLLVDEEPAGLVAVEYGDAAARFTPTQLALFEGMAALAGVALRAGRQRSQTQRLEHLASSIGALAAVRTARGVAEHALTAVLDVARVDTGLFATLSATAAEVVAVRGSQLPEPGRYPLTALPESLVSTCLRTWAEDPHALAAVELDGRQLAVLPIGAPAAAVIVLPLVSSLLARDVVGEMQLVAAAAAVQLRSARLADEREWHRDVLFLLATASHQVGVTESLPGLVDQLCGLLAVVGVAAPRVVAERGVARKTGLPPAQADVARLIARWRRAGGRAAQASTGNDVALPLYADGRVVGALLVATVAPVEMSARAAQLVVLLGALLGRASALQDARGLELRVADAASHTAIATRAYLEAGQLLGLLSNALHTGRVDGSSPAGAAPLLLQVRRLLRDATEVLAPAAAPQADLRVALTALTRQIRAHGGPETVVRALGRAPVLDAAGQVAVLRAVQRILALLRELRAVAATITIERSAGDVVLTLRTDELIAAASDGPGLLATRRDVRGWLEPVGGTLEVSYDGPVHCFVVRAPGRASDQASKSVIQPTSGYTGHSL